MPTPNPTMVASASGVLNTRSDPNSRWSPWLTLKTPPLPFTSVSASSRLASATSCPNTTTRGSRSNSARRVALMRSTIVPGFAPGANRGSVSNSAEQGSTRGL